MENPDTELIRKAAPDWSLAGDKQLLQILEQMHEKIVSKCQEVNQKLDVMVNTLDTASIDLQNVNNKFMALSNSQFIESRVYDDDVLVGDSEEKVVPPAADEESELVKIKRCLQALDEMHETVQILDSDTSDNEDELRIILKPKDVYAHRPLPYIIGSDAWREKWHVGLVVSDSESDSSESASRRRSPREQYSESESDQEQEYRGQATEQRGEGEVVSSSEGESGVAASPAAVAAQIARRLAAQRPMSLEVQSRGVPEPKRTPDAAAGKVYRPERPLPSNVFSDEPPPLQSDSDSSTEEDIFAELHKKPQAPASRPGGAHQRNIVDDLFGDQGLFDDNSVESRITPVPTEKSALFKQELESNLTKRKELEEPKQDLQQQEQQRAGKKPIGAMSLFGSSQGAESIGAAILKRNRKKSSTSEDDNSDAEPKTQPSKYIESTPENTSKIIADLFAKPNVRQIETIKEKDNNTKDSGVTESKLKDNPVNTKIDLFSDNIFDDIDDIFTTDIVTKPKESTQKSIFDDDDDYDGKLFAETPVKTNANEKKKSMFDSDEELFKSDILSHNDITSSIDTKKYLSKDTNVYEKPKGIFKDDKDETFSNKKQDPSPAPAVFESHKTSTLLIKDNISKKDVTHNEKDDVSSSFYTKNEEHVEPTLNISTIQPRQGESPLLFGEEDIDDLFIKKPESSETSSKHGNDDDERLHNEKINTTKLLEDTSSQSSFKEIENTRSHHNKNSTKKDDKNNIKKVSDLEQDNSLLSNEDVRETNKRNTLDKEEITTEQILKESLERIEENKQNDAFDDLFGDLPPAFEKPTQPKKSKNVNALFDDDSDDESLFFKKNDVSEEKPEDVYNDDRFRIFHDEPPDIDIDFSQKPKSATNIPPGEHLLSFKEPSTLVENTSEVLNDQKSGETINEALVENEFKQKRRSALDISEPLNDEIKDSSPKTEDDETIKCASNDELVINSEITAHKSIGKLKPLNFVINVNTLVPGSTLKKPRSSDESDGQTLSYKSNEEINRYTSQIMESKIVKSVSFDGDPESNVLDNKVSKGRARIQVKRRPSSRRARLEAVRKSGIDLNDDSTDNSSSFDEPKPIQRFVDRNQSVINDQRTDKFNKEQNDKIGAVKEPNLNSRQTQSIENDIINTDSMHKANINVQDNSNKTTSKTVYILHDEDIFADSPLTQTDVDKKSTTVTDDNDDDIFKKPPSDSFKDNHDKVQKKIIENVEVKPNIVRNMQGTSAKSVKSIFDDLSDDDELFGGKKSSVKFESDDNLFVKSESDNNKALEKRRALSEAAKGSLFGEESDEELFRSPHTSDPKQTKPKESYTSTKPVLQDPLSLFEEDS